MNDAEALTEAIRRTGHRRYAVLLDPADPAYDPSFWPVVRRIAESPPGLLGMAGTAAAAAAGFVASGFKTADDEVYRERLEACASCEHFIGSRCRLCGCFTSAKAKLVDPSCPAGKWPR